MNWNKFIMSLDNYDMMQLRAAIKFREDETLTEGEKNSIHDGRRVDAARSIRERTGLSLGEVVAIIRKYEGVK